MKKDSRPDELLYAAYQAGEASAGAELYDRYFAIVRGFFINKVADAGSWDDLAQKTFEIILLKADNFRADSSFRTYLLGVAHNVLRSDYRRRLTEARYVTYDSEELEQLAVFDLEGSNSSLAANRAEAQRLINALRQIPIKYQAVFEMYYWQELSAGEIAKIYACPIGTVRGRLRLAKLALLEKLELQRGNFGELLRGFRSVAEWAREVQAELG
ncbi:RNA polymerase sigma factor [Nannocystis sp. SCPEA4]|uniref:RNA polymerase sigma factor n=1 Tax=Nannocystis sp. SCPEA4 TaxID=2996787 RepID=UPI00226E8DB5|nr:RNA polymerase sigma factor [Nannocystis sp. SCPEA4]MCY1060220.1 RNA polymerase sigma factor [Nannocystis sp. SCPEA4]